MLSIPDTNNAQNKFQTNGWSGIMQRCITFPNIFDNHLIFLIFHFVKTIYILVFITELNKCVPWEKNI